MCAIRRMVVPLQRKPCRSFGVSVSQSCYRYFPPSSHFHELFHADYRNHLRFTWVGYASLRSLVAHTSSFRCHRHDVFCTLRNSHRHHLLFPTQRKSSQGNLHQQISRYFALRFLAQQIPQVVGTCTHWSPHSYPDNISSSISTPFHHRTTDG